MRQCAVPAILEPHLLCCIDIGARGGMQRHWRPLSGFLKNIDLFEPDAEACKQQAQMARPNESWFPIALGGRTGVGQLYVTKKPSGASLYPPNEEIILRFAPPSYGTLDKVIDVPLVTLSDFIDQYDRPLPNLLKLDVQGAELDIFRKLRPEHWADVLAIQTEVEFVPFYKGQPLFADVDAFLRDQGFVMFDLLPSRSYRFDGENSHGQLRRHLNLVKNRNDISRRLIEGDALYLRSPEIVLASGDVPAILKLFIILLLYRFFDEALWLAERARSEKFISQADEQELIGLVKAVAPRPSLMQRADWLGKLTRRLTKRLGIGRRRKVDFWLDRSWDF